MTDSDDGTTDSIDADALREALPTERVRNALDLDGLASGDDVGGAVRDRLRGRDAATGLLALGLGFDGFVFAVGRYLPEYLGVLGADPLAIGLIGTLALALPALYAGRWPASLREYAPVLAPAVAASGLVLWLFAPASPGPLPGWSLVALGLPLVAAPLAVRDTAPIVPRPDALCVTPTDDDRRAVGAAAVALLVVTALLAVAAGVDGALRITLALAAVGGATLATLRAVTSEADRPTDGVSACPPATDSASEVRSRPSVARVIGTVADLSSPARSLLVGEALVDAAVGAVSVFVVVVVTTVLEFQVTVLGVTLGPSAVFGALVLVELLAAAGTRTVASRLDGVLAPGSRLVLGGAVAAAFPLALVSAPPVPWLVGGLFAWYGLRTVGAAARRDLVGDALAGTDVEPDGYRTVRDLLIAPSAVLGGLLYGASPTLAFGAATAVGAVGTSELLRSARVGLAQ